MQAAAVANPEQIKAARVRLTSLASSTKRSAAPLLASSAEASKGDSAALADAGAGADAVQPAVEEAGNMAGKLQQVPGWP